jgi:ankyrin repeat protein
MKILMQILYVPMGIILFCSSVYATIFEVRKISNDAEVAKYNQLFVAVQTGNLEEVQKLLNEGVDINGKNPFLGKTALMHASGQGLTEVVEFLLERGADANAKTDEGETALMIASAKRNSNIVKLLLDKGAEVNAKTTYGKTALWIASDNKHSDVVRILVNNGADVNQKDSQGITALMRASALGDADTIKILLEMSADVNTTDINGTTTVMAAIKSGHADVVQLLKKAGAKIGEKDYTDIYNSVARDNLRNAATAQEAYYIKNMTYCDSLERLEGDAYGLHLGEGVTIKIVSANAEQYRLIAFHKQGNKKYQITGPGQKIKEYSE